ncbi:ATP-binding protein [Streptomyces sp. NBC_00620]|uniref:ATP-binding protein n=1 Tax=Streptomyces sp. NBC_00620 TaxID=2903666 RepID=UPI002257521B|nr:ATP-binding protein [Streptomyces sp. NBC_00620]MCX4976252.1 ATP-binding protein [Streptomyces sp. NBC_00620]
MDKSPATDRLHLAAVELAVPSSRWFVRHVLRHWQLDNYSYVAQLLACELVTNAVAATGVVGTRPTRPELPSLNLVAVQLRTYDRRLFVEVWDCDPNPPVVQEWQPGAESGRGLVLIEAMSRRWGTYNAGASGKVVWAELELGAPAIPPEETPPLPKPRVEMPRVRRGHRHYSAADTALLQRITDGLDALDDVSSDTTASSRQ